MNELNNDLNLIWVDLIEKNISYLRPIDWENDINYIISEKENRWFLKVYKKKLKDIIYWCCDMNGGFFLEHFFPTYAHNKMSKNVYTLHFLNSFNLDDSKNEAYDQLLYSKKLILKSNFILHKSRSQKINNILKNIKDDDNN